MWYAFRSCGLRLGWGRGSARSRRFALSPGLAWRLANPSPGETRGGRWLSARLSQSWPRKACTWTKLARCPRTPRRSFGGGRTALRPWRGGSASSPGDAQRPLGVAFSRLCQRRRAPGCGDVEGLGRGLGSWLRPRARSRGSRTRSTGSAHACGSVSPSVTGLPGPGAATNAAATPTRRPLQAARAGSA